MPLFTPTTRHPGRHPGRGLLFFPQTQQSRKQYVISGVTRDNLGAVLGGCTVDLFTTVDDVRQATTTSDPTTGAYSFQVGTAATYYAMARGTGVAGVTDDTLVGA